jgi:RNA-dependent RNA polymerase
MQRRENGRPQGGYRGYGNHGDSDRSDGVAYSSSSSESNGQAFPTRPVIKHPSNPTSRVGTPEQVNTGPARVDSSLAPTTPSNERSSFLLNGHQVIEFYKPRLSMTASPPKPSTPVSPVIRNGSPRQRSDSQCMSNGTFRRNIRGHWALEQESKIRIVGIPKYCWTKDVYFAMSSFGTVTRIEMEGGSRDNNAWVIYQ